MDAGAAAPAAETVKPKRARAASPRRAARKTAGAEPSSAVAQASDSITQLAGAVGTSVPASNGIDREEIARLAYSYWEARGCTGGSPEEDWHRAEQELKLRRMAANG